MTQVSFRYEVYPLPEDEGGGFAAIASDLPGCMSDGETAEEAVANLQDAAAGWIAEAQRVGMDVPAMRQMA